MAGRHPPPILITQARPIPVEICPTSRHDLDCLMTALRVVSDCLIGAGASHLRRDLPDLQPEDAAARISLGAPHPPHVAHLRAPPPPLDPTTPARWPPPLSTHTLDHTTPLGDSHCAAYPISISTDDSTVFETTSSDELRHVAEACGAPTRLKPTRTARTPGRPPPPPSDLSRPQTPHPPAGPCSASSSDLSRP
eukprot:4450271-Prymnesium_polylepis.1